MNVTSNEYWEQLKQTLKPNELSVRHPEDFVKKVLQDGTNSTIDSYRFIYHLFPEKVLPDILRWTYYLIQHNNPFITIDDERYIIDSSSIQRKDEDGFYHVPFELWDIGKMVCEWINAIHENPYSQKDQYAEFQKDFDETDALCQAIMKEPLISAINIYYAFAGPMAEEVLLSDPEDPDDDPDMNHDERYLGVIMNKRDASEIIDPEDPYTTQTRDDFLFQVYDFLLEKGMDPMVSILTYRFTRSLIYGADDLYTYWGPDDPNVKIPSKHGNTDTTYSFDRWFLRYLFAMYYCADPTPNHVERIHILLPHYSEVSILSFGQVSWTLISWVFHIHVCTTPYVVGMIQRIPTFRKQIERGDDEERLRIIDRNIDFIIMALTYDRNKQFLNPINQIVTNEYSDALTFYLQYIVYTKTQILNQDTDLLLSALCEKICMILFGIDPNDSMYQDKTLKDFTENQLDQLSEMSALLPKIFEPNQIDTLIDYYHVPPRATKCRVFNLFLYLGLCINPNDPIQLNVRALKQILYSTIYALTKDELRDLSNSNMGEKLSNYLNQIRSTIVSSYAIEDVIKRYYPDKI